MTARALPTNLARLIRDYYRDTGIAPAVEVTADGTVRIMPAAPKQPVDEFDLVDMRGK